MPACHSQLKQRVSVWENSVPILLAVLCVGLLELVQVAKLDSSMATVVSDIQEIKVDSKERLNNIEQRLRQVELKLYNQPAP